MSIVFIISAPSGSGKSTLVNKVRHSVPNLEFSISYTTRRSRGNERDGCEYFFITRDRFEQMIREDEFLEFADVFGNYYGTSRRFLRKAEQENKDLLLDIDVQGADQIKKKLSDAICIFILPPNRMELEKRLRARSQDSEPVIQRRLSAARREIENYPRYAYIVVNDRLEDSAGALEAILLSERLKRNGQNQPMLTQRAESCRLNRMRERVDQILRSFGETAGSGQ